MELIFWYFIAYSFIGYCLEKIYAAAIHAPRQTRKCFLLLPLCPVYGPVSYTHLKPHRR